MDGSACLEKYDLVQYNTYRNKSNMSLYFVSGFLTNFISAPVISAFTSAVSINVMTSQVKGLLGLKKVILNPSSFGLYIFRQYRNIDLH